MRLNSQIIPLFVLGFVSSCFARAATIPNNITTVEGSDSGAETSTKPTHDATKPDDIKTPKPTGKSWCGADGNIYEPEGDCSQFWQKSENTGDVLKDCPVGLLFDVNICNCNWPKHVTCEEEEFVFRVRDEDEEGSGDDTETDQPPPARTTPAVVTRPVPIWCGSNDNVYTPSEDCSQFWQTSKNTGSVLKDCPIGLLFDVNICACNWPQRVRRYQAC